MTTALHDYLASKSSLTGKQIERLTLQLSLQKPRDVSVPTERPHKTLGISEGAYYRTLDQGRQNVKEALYTVLLCARIGLIQSEDLRRLFDLMSKVPQDVSDAESNQVMSLVEALVGRIVML